MSFDMETVAALLAGQPACRECNLPATKEAEDVFFCDDCAPVDATDRDNAAAVRMAMEARRQHEARARAARQGHAEPPAPPSPGPTAADYRRLTGMNLRQITAGAWMLAVYGRDYVRASAGQRLGRLHDAVSHAAGAVEGRVAVPALARLVGWIGRLDGGPVPETRDRTGLATVLFGDAKAAPSWTRDGATEKPPGPAQP